MCDCKKTTHDEAPKTGKKIFVTIHRNKTKDAAVQTVKPSKGK